MIWKRGVNAMSAQFGRREAGRLERVSRLGGSSEPKACRRRVVLGCVCAFFALGGCVNSGGSGLGLASTRPDSSTVISSGEAQPGVSPTTGPRSSAFKAAPLQKWSIPEGLAGQLQGALEARARWAILEKVVQQNSPDGSYSGPVSAKLRCRDQQISKALANLEQEFLVMTRIGIDPNVENGERISHIWASMKFKEHNSRKDYLNTVSATRRLLWGRGPGALKINRDAVVAKANYEFRVLRSTLDYPGGMYEFNDRLGRPFYGFKALLVNRRTDGVPPDMGDLFFGIFGCSDDFDGLEIHELTRIGLNTDFKVSFMPGQDGLSIADVPEVADIVIYHR